MEMLRLDRDPFGSLARLQDEMNRLFERSFGTLSSRRVGPQEFISERIWSPVVDVYEDQDNIILRAELPGMKQDEIDIDLTGDTLTIHGERKFADEEHRDNYVRVERAYGEFKRSFTIGVPIQADKVKATYKDGILEVTIPKAEEVKPKKVKVGIG